MDEMERRHLAWEVAQRIESGAVILAAVMGVGGLFMGLAGFDAKATKDQFIKAAIERGYAQHCPKDGKFAWRGECD